MEVFGRRLSGARAERKKRKAVGEVGQFSRRRLGVMPLGMDAGQVTAASSGHEAALAGGPLRFPWCTAVDAARFTAMLAGFTGLISVG